ncbi:MULTISPECIES: hypothetical protein [unclassified Myroides]|uniref:hypothetical protein n=1 Tax=unclassified Myroides TaxID=2642485 RepID=UPI003D2F840D
MRKIHLYCSVMLFLLSFSAFAQKETYNWFYGSGQGITWNTTRSFEGEPIDAPNTRVTLTGIPTRYESEITRPKMFPISTREGVFSLSDAKGNLLFYSSGSTIYNAEHDIMKNATELEGHPSSAQSGIIVPFPRSKTKYVAVSIGVSWGGGGGFAYNILDIEAENGLGELILPKNRAFVLPQGTVKASFVENLAATKHANGVDYWIIAISRMGTNSKMVAWLLTEEGVSDTPVVSSIIGPGLYSNSDAYGYLKVSPNGKYFALMEHKARNILWGEFNKQTGVFSNIRDYKSLTNSRGIDNYGAEFSPNGKYLYVSSAGRTTNIAYVFDFNELLRGNVEILKTYVASANNNYYSGAIQLGPDLRMYMTVSPPSYVDRNAPSVLYMFEEPNEPLTTKVYALKNLSPGTGVGGDGVSGTRIGLPTFASSFFVEVEGTTTVCVGEEAVYRLSSNAERIEIDFDEGDGPTIINNVEELKHSFKRPGNYLIKLRPLNGEGEPIQEEIKTIYTMVYSCYLPVNHNLLNAEY